MQIRYTDGVRIKRGNDYCPELRSDSKMLRCGALGTNNWPRKLRDTAKETNNHIQLI